MTQQEVCYWLLCFVPLELPGNPKIFGFAEFIQALALLVVLYTIADTRYKFRLAITPGALYPTTFGLIAVITIQTLMTDVWLAQGWWVPKTVGLTRNIWQAIFGALFLGAFLTWTYYAFIRPPVFGRRNARRFAQTLYRVVLTGNDADLTVIGNELARSAAPLIKYSKRVRQRDGDDAQAQPPKRRPNIEDYAHDLLLLIGNRKLCRHIIQSSPVTALAFFDAMATEKKYDLPIGQFAKNISVEAIANKDSILYHEDDGFTSGLIGYQKPWSQTIYGNFELVETLANRYGSPLDVDRRAGPEWDAEQWDAYARATLITFKSFLSSSRRHGSSSYAFNRALSELEGAFGDVYKLNGDVVETWRSDIYKRLHVAVDFVRKAVELLDAQEKRPSTVLRRRKGDYQKDIYDQLAHFMFEIIFAASSVSAPSDTCWSIHHNATWGQFFGMTRQTKAWRIVQFKLRRLLYDEVERMTDLPNYKGARILGLLLNVIGMKVSKGKDGIDREYRPLARAVLAWTRANYLTLRDRLPDVAEAALIGSITFDADGRRLVKTYIQGLRKEAPKDYLYLAPATPIETVV